MKLSCIRLLILIAFLAVSTASRAQEFYGGAILGVNACQVGGDEHGGYKKFGVMAGGFVGFQFTPMSALRMELEYSMKGSREVPANNLDDEYWENFRIQEHCVDLPVLYQLRLNRYISFLAGLSGTFLFFFEQTGWSMEAGSQESNFASLNFVAGVNFHINDKWAVDFRTSNGLTPIQSNGFSPRRLFGILPNGLYNDILTLSVSYNFGKGAKE